ncbi:MAG: methyltransferase [Helicobacteraceae bacterium]|nr:methyltransferase [Helicobacteraceae bacterium]
MILHQSQEGYRYNTDSILLYHFAKQKALKGAVLDVGCGCGVIGLLLARDYGVALTGVDIQREMIDFCCQNSERNGIKAEFVCADFRSFACEKKFDTIVSNPPFYSPCTTHSKNDAIRTARNAATLPIGDLLKCAGKFLSSEGDLFFCYDADCLFDLTQCLRESRYYPKSVQFVHTNSGKKARLVLIRAKKSLTKAVNVMPPLFLYDKNGISADIREISMKADTLCVA